VEHYTAHHSECGVLSLQEIEQVFARDKRSSLFFLTLLWKKSFMAWVIGEAKQ
jgi:hypothetical protein